MTKNNFSKNKKTSRKKSFRIYILVAFIIVAVGFVYFRLYNLQVSAHDYYQELAFDQHKTYEDLVAKRGEIFVDDSQGYYPVAVNKELNLVYAVPREIEDPNSAAQQIASILDLNQNELEAKLNQPNGWYAVIAHNVDDDKANEIKGKKIKGVYIFAESKRVYPSGSFASQLIGFVGSDGSR